MRQQQHARTWRDGPKEDHNNSPKQAGSSCWFVCQHSWLATSDANLYPPGVWLQTPCRLSLVLPRFWFCLVIVFLLPVKSRPFVQSFFVIRYGNACAPTATRVSFLFFFFFWRCLFFQVFLYHCRFLFVWRIRRTFFPFGWCFLIPCDHGLDFFHQTSLIYENSINQPVNRSCSYGRSAFISNCSILAYCSALWIFTLLWGNSAKSRGDILCFDRGVGVPREGSKTGPIDTKSLLIGQTIIQGKPWVFLDIPGYPPEHQ